MLLVLSVELLTAILIVILDVVVSHLVLVGIFGLLRLAPHLRLLVLLVALLGGWTNISIAEWHLELALLVALVDLG